MDPKDVLDATRSYGLPLVFLIVVLWIVVNKVGPFLEKRVENSEKMAREIFDSSQTRWAEASKEFVVTVQQERAILERMLQELDRIKTDTTEIKAAIQILAKHVRIID